MISSSKLEFLLRLLCICCTLVALVRSSLPSGKGEIYRHQRHKKTPKGIVDGAGYSIHSTLYPTDLAMQANPPLSGEPLGIVTLEPFTNGRNQKWGTSFYGTNQVYVSNGQVERNFVSVYFPNGSSRDKARLYNFEEIPSSPNTYKIKNLETQQCLSALQGSSSSQITVQFGSCSDDGSSNTWLLRRTG